MAKKSIIERNEKRRRMAQRYRKRRDALQAIVKDRSRRAEERFEAVLRLAALPRNSSRTRVENRCRVTGRGRGVYRRFGLSRIILRELASFGQIPGAVRSSW